MASRTGSYKLNNGLYVSGKPEQPKDRAPTMASCAAPYTGGDIKKSGELGKMYGVILSSGEAPGLPLMKAPSKTVRSGSNSGELGHKSNHSGPGPIPKKSSSSSSFSGPNPIQPTGLITSSSVRSAGRNSGQIDPPVSTKVKYGSVVTKLNNDSRKLGFRVSRLAIWVFLVLVLMALVVGVFLMVAVKKAIVLFVLAAVVAPALVVLIWNFVYRERSFVRFLRNYPDDDLMSAVDGQFIKITGVVTCGTIPLEASFQRIPRCVYSSTELYEYRGWGAKPANSRHCLFSWGLRHSEKYVADFYISDNRSGQRALVKAGNGVKVAPFIESSTVAEITNSNRDSSPNFSQWIADRSLTIDDRVMRLKEGCVKEGGTVSVMGVLRRNADVLMIVPPRERVPVSCQWLRCLIPTYTEGLILTSEESQSDVIPV